MVTETNLPVEPPPGPVIGQNLCPDGQLKDAMGNCPGTDTTNALPPPPGTDPLPDAGGGEQECGPCYQWSGTGCLPKHSIVGSGPGTMTWCLQGGEGGTGTEECQPGQIYDPASDGCVTTPEGDAGCQPGEVLDQYTGQCRPSSQPSDPLPPPPAGDGGDPYDTNLPGVDPYDISDSRDWMNIFDYGGENSNVNAINPQAQDMAYDQINQFSDAAYQNQMRYLEPQEELQDDRFAQELINKGIDPNSEAGQKAFRQKSMAQNDARSNAAFSAMGFGTDIQNQMYQQDYGRSQLANAMLQSQMGLSQRGHEFDTQAGMRTNDQAFGQMMGLEGLNYRDYLTGVDQSRYQDSLALALAGLAPAPNYQTFNTGLPQAAAYDSQNQQGYFNNLYGGG